jgi:hypothetical protein
MWNLLDIINYMLLLTAIGMRLSMLQRTDASLQKITEISQLADPWSGADQVI